MANRSTATDSPDLARLRHRFEGQGLLPGQDGYHHPGSAADGAR